MCARSAANAVPVARGRSRFAPGPHLAVPRKGGSEKGDPKAKTCIITATRIT